MKEFKHILYFDSSSGLGGSGSVLYQFLNHLDKKRHRPFVVVYNEGPQIKKIASSGISVTKFNYTEITLRPGNWIVNYLKLLIHLVARVLPVALKAKQFLVSNEIDIVHINTDIISGLPFIFAARSKKIRCVCHIRQTRELTRIEQIFSKFVDRFIVLNWEAVDVYKKYISTSKIHMVYDGLDTESFINIKPLDIQEEFQFNGSGCVCVTGRIVKGKGHDDFVQAATKVKKNYPDVKFLIVGSDHQEGQPTLNSLKELVKSVGLENDVIFTGWRNDVKEIVKACDIFVHPTSTFAEGLPSSIIEAMLLEKPVVATRIAGSSEIVEHNVTGLLVSKESPEELANAIWYLLKDKETARQFGLHGKERAEKLFNIEQNISNIQNIYTQLMQGNGK